MLVIWQLWQYSRMKGRSLYKLVRKFQQIYQVNKLNTLNEAAILSWHFYTYPVPAYVVGPVRPQPTTFRPAMTDLEKIGVFLRLFAEVQEKVLASRVGLADCRSVINIHCDISMQATHATWWSIECAGTCRWWSTSRIASYQTFPAVPHQPPDFAFPRRMFSKKWYCTMYFNRHLSIKPYLLVL